MSYNKNEGEGTLPSSGLHQKLILQNRPLKKANGLCLVFKTMSESPQ